MENLTGFQLDRLEKLERENSQLHEKLTKLEYVQSQLEVSLI